MPVFHGLINGKPIRIETGVNGELVIDGKSEIVDLRKTGEGRFSALVNGRSVSMSVSGSADNRSYLVNGKRVAVEIESERARLLKSLAKSGSDEAKPVDIRSPMPALVSLVPVQVGEAVVAGQALIVLEAMKMENEVRAHSDGVIAKVLVKKGDSVEKGALLLRVEKPTKSE